MDESLDWTNFVNNSCEMFVFQSRLVTHTEDEKCWICIFLTKPMKRRKMNPISYLLASVWENVSQFRCISRVASLHKLFIRNMLRDFQEFVFEIST